jgi:uncharacterized membrane protein
VTRPPFAPTVALLAAPLLALALSVAPLLAQGACRHGGDSGGVSAAPPQPATLQARSHATPTASAGGGAPGELSGAVRTWNGAGSGAACRPLGAGAPAPARLAAWGRLQLDGG